MDKAEPRIRRTTIERRGLLQEVFSTESPDARHFRTDQPVLAETGAVVWAEGDEMVVEHLDGHSSRHHGEWLTYPHAWCSGGWDNLFVAVGLHED